MSLPAVAVPGQSEQFNFIATITATSSLRAPAKLSGEREHA